MCNVILYVKVYVLYEYHISEKRAFSLYVNVCTCDIPYDLNMMLKKSMNPKIAPPSFDVTTRFRSTESSILEHGLVVNFESIKINRSCTFFNQQKCSYGYPFFLHL